MARRKQRTPEAPVTISPLKRHGAVWVVATFTFLFTFFTYAGAGWLAALYHLLIDGPIVLVWLAAMLGVGAWLAKFLGLSGERIGIATNAALGIGSVSLLILILGWAGVLNRGLAWVLLIGGVALGVVHVVGERKFNPVALSSALNARANWTTWLWLIAVPFFAIATLGALVPPGLLWGPEEPNGYDVVEYHLQIPREWFEAGRIIPLHHNVFSYFPFNVEMHYLLAMHLRGGPWAGMYLAQLMHVAMIGLTALAIHRLAASRRDGLSSTSAEETCPSGTPQNESRTTATLFAISAPWFALLAPLAYNEGGLLLFGTLAIGWIWQAITTPELRTRFMILAGIMAGLACGVKLTAVPMLLLAIPLALVFRQPTVWLRPIAAFLIGGVLVFSPWLIRNFIWTRNPVFPEAMSLLGRAHFSPEQVERWRLAYIPPIAQQPVAARLKAAWDQIFADWRFGFVLIPAGLFALIRTVKDAKSLFLLSLLILWLGFWLFFTHLQGRFFVLAIPVMALLISRIRSPLAGLAVTCGMLLQAGFALLNLYAHLEHVIGGDRSIVIGLDDPQHLLEEKIATVADGKGTLSLVGDAKAFWYQIPMSRLRYRTVFDVDARGHEAVDAWFDGFPRADGDTILIDYNELRRFSRTYHGIPPVTRNAMGRVIVDVGK